MRARLARAFHVFWRSPGLCRCSDDWLDYDCVWRDDFSGAMGQLQ